MHYYRHHGPTAIAPGYKKVSLKAKPDYGVAGMTDQSTSSGSPSSHRGSIQDGSADSGSSGLLPLFDMSSSLPAKDILPQLIDKFFEYYGDYFCFLNKNYLNDLMQSGQASPFLVCVMCGLASRFCDPELFENYFPLQEGQREQWEYAIPFLERSKALLMPLLSLPSEDIVSGLIMMAWLDFGDNNEAGMSLISSVQ